VSLVARELESRGIATVCLSLLREVTEKVKPPRTLVVPFGWGQPLGPPGLAEIHEAVVDAALAMLGEPTGETDRAASPRIREFEPERG